MLIKRPSAPCHFTCHNIKATADHIWDSILPNLRAKDWLCMDKRACPANRRIAHKSKRHTATMGTAVATSLWGSGERSNPRLLRRDTGHAALKIAHPLPLILMSMDPHPERTIMPHSPHQWTPHPERRIIRSTPSMDPTPPPERIISLRSTHR